MSREIEMPLAEIQPVTKQADKSRRDHAEEETVGEAMSPDHAGTPTKQPSAAVQQEEALTCHLLHHSWSKKA